MASDAVCKLHKSIYGLKHASRQWFIKFSTTLVHLGFEKCHGDHTLFVKGVNEIFLVVIVYVDDILIASNCDDAVIELKSQLSSAFHLRDLGPPKKKFGIEIARSEAGISLCQRKYVLDLLASSCFADCKPSTIPMEPNQKMSKDDGVLLEDGKPYMKLVEKLQYLTITRPNIAFAVSKLAQYSSAPRDSHLQAIHKVLRYLKDSIGQGLFYGTDATFVLEASLIRIGGAFPDTIRLVTGYAMFIGNSLVFWKSKKQHMVSLSSAEAEYRAMCMTTKEIIWISQMLKDL